MDHSVWGRRCGGDTGEVNDGWIADSVWDRCYGDNGEGNGGRGMGHRWNRRCGDTGDESEGRIAKRVGQMLWQYW